MVELVVVTVAHIHKYAVPVSGTVGACLNDGAVGNGGHGCSGGDAEIGPLVGAASSAGFRRAKGISCIDFADINRGINCTWGVGGRKRGRAVLLCHFRVL